MAQSAFSSFTTFLVVLMMTVTGCHGFFVVPFSQTSSAQRPTITAKKGSNNAPSCLRVIDMSLFESNNNNDIPNTGVLSPRQYIYQGTEQFRSGNVQGSIDSFNAAAQQMGTTRPYLWQRGISYYYVDNFSAASQQFRDDVLQSPLDVEEIVWDIACLARMAAAKNTDAKFPPANKLSLPPGKKDRRPIMAIVYNLFRGDATEHDLANFGHQGSPADEFYSLFYLGLYNDARRDMTKAEQYMKAAVQTKYATIVGSKDYMVDVAKVHCQVRRWTS